jgi:hypothetical protein
MRTQAPWAERIKRAKTVGHFTAVDRRNVGQWPSCAVGEHVPLLKKQRGIGYAEQVDSYTIFNDMGEAGKILDGLGMDFYYAVKNNDVKAAAAVLKQIKAVKL